MAAIVTGSGWEADALKVVASLCGVSVTGGASDSSPAAVSLGGKTAVSGVLAAAHALAAAGGGGGSAAAPLCGVGAEHEAEVADVVAKCHGMAAADLANALGPVMAHKTFAVGEALSVADCALYAALAPYLAGLPEQKRCAGPLAPLARHAALVAAVADPHNVVAPLPPLKLPPLKLPAEPAPAAGGKEQPADKGGKKDAAANNKGGGKEEKKGKENNAAADKPKQADANKGGGGGADAKPAAKEKGEKKEKKAKELPQKKEVALSPGMLDVRVGTIVKVWEHPDADGLWCEEIDFGEEKGPRQVVSGLRKFVPKERMEGARVVVLCNAKPGNLRGVRSEGVVMCGSNADHTDVDFVVPPEGVPNGERVTFAGHDRAPEEQLNPKKKIYEGLQPLLKTDASGVANYDGVPFMTTKGPCVSRITGGSVA